MVEVYGSLNSVEGHASPKFAGGPAIDLPVGPAEPLLELFYLLFQLAMLFVGYRVKVSLVVYCLYWRTILNDSTASCRQ